MTSTSSDPELLRLLILELERHLVTLEAEPRDVPSVQRAVHALKGSAGLAGERELAAALERLHRRVKEGDESAFAEAGTLVRVAVQRLLSGESAIAAHWPIPPDDLGARPFDPLVLAQYAAEVTDRLARIDEALSSGDDPLEAALTAFDGVDLAELRVKSQSVTGFFIDCADALLGDAFSVVTPRSAPLSEA